MSYYEGVITRDSDSYIEDVGALENPISVEIDGEGLELDTDFRYSSPYLTLHRPVKRGQVLGVYSKETLDQPDRFSDQNKNIMLSKMLNRLKGVKNDRSYNIGDCASLIRPSITPQNSKNTILLYLCNNNYFCMPYSEPLKEDLIEFRLAKGILDGGILDVTGPKISGRYIYVWKTNDRLLHLINRGSGGIVNYSKVVNPLFVGDYTIAEIVHSLGDVVSQVFYCSSFIGSLPGGLQVPEATEGGIVSYRIQRDGVFIPGSFNTDFSYETVCFSGSVDKSNELIDNNSVSISFSDQQFLYGNRTQPGSFSRLMGWYDGSSISDFVKSSEDFVEIQGPLEPVTIPPRATPGRFVIAFKTNQKLPLGFKRIRPMLSSLFVNGGGDYFDVEYFSEGGLNYVVYHTGNIRLSPTNPETLIWGGL